MFDFRLFRERQVKVRLRDGSRVLGSFRLVLADGWVEAKPTLWLSDWSLEHFVTLDHVQELEAA
ncbi:MAG TPA: hypothetical protein VEA19_06955 [Actinomycetota bacterium]|nr:hypothetical protein [Actinomycetota bacterium]